MGPRKEQDPSSVTDDVHHQVIVLKYCSSCPPEQPARYRPTNTDELRLDHGIAKSLAIPRIVRTWQTYIAQCTRALKFIVVSVSSTGAKMSVDVMRCKAALDAVPAISYVSNDLCSAQVR